MKKIESNKIRHLIKPIKREKIKIGAKIYGIMKHTNSSKFSYEYAYPGEIISFDGGTRISAEIQKENEVIIRIPFDINQTNADMNFILIDEFLYLKIKKILKL